MTAGPLVYLIAGEPSGDLLAGRLMAALKSRTGGLVHFAGVGGESMAEEGMTSLFSLSDVAVMGIMEVLPKAPLIFRRVRETVEDILRVRPDVVVTVDSWGFTGRVHKALRKRGVKVPQIHYVAPMVWAWREGRARHMAGRIDHLMTLLPNEPAYFTAHGIEATHVGHPVIETGAGAGDGPGFRARHDIPPTAPLLCVLPGSRRSETARLLPIMAETVRRLQESHEGLCVVVPTVATVASEVREAVWDWPLRSVIVEGSRERYDAFAAANVALAASGTVALELAMAELPSVITYKVSPLSAMLARRLLKIRFVSLVNLLVDRAVLPELVQAAARPDLLADAVSALLMDESARAEQIAGMREATDRLGRGRDRPSQRAAELVWSHIDAGRQE